MSKKSKGGIKDEWGKVWPRVPWPHNFSKPYSEWECYKGTYSGRSIIIFKAHDREFWSYVAKGSHSGYLVGATTPHAAIDQLKDERSLN